MSILHSLHKSPTTGSPFSAGKMGHRHPVPAAAAATLALTLTLLLIPSSQAHNITKILAKHPEFSTFNHYLTVTHLAAEINRRETITVLAIDNAAMNTLLAKQFSVYTLRNVLSYHVLVDYFGTKKLHQINGGTTLTATMFQATGAATGTSGYVNITNLSHGKVGFGPEENDGLDSFFVKSVVEIPYNISVIQISQALNSVEAEAPTAAPTLNLTAIMNKQGCKAFSDLLIASGAHTTFEDSLDGGLTVFCPPDSVVNAFMPKYKNLTASKKLSLLLYHGLPVYMSLQMLKSNNGLMNTLATDGANKYDFTVQNDGEVITLETKVNTVKITGTLKDEEPLVVYKVDKVLMPRDLFKAAAADSPKSAKSSDADGPAADGPADYSDDQVADKSGIDKFGSDKKFLVCFSLCFGLMIYF